MEIKYSHVKTEYDQILEKLSNTTDRNELEKLGRRQAELLPSVKKIDRLDQIKKEIDENEKLVG